MVLNQALISLHVSPSDYHDGSGLPIGRRRRLQVFRQEFFHRGVEIESVFFVMKAVPLVFFDHIFHFNAAFPQRLNDLV